MEKQLDKGPSQAQQAITRDNFLSKLCFVVTGDGLPAAGGTLRAQLQAYAGKQDGRLVSAVAVRSWFEGTNPSRTNAFEFIYNFLSNRMDYDELSDDRKKVHRQLLSFIGDRGVKIDSEVTGGISIGKSGSILINPLKMTKHDQDDLISAWQGTYLSFRARVIQGAGSPDSASRPYAMEVVRLNGTKSKLRYRHWHLRDGQYLSYFEGSVLVSKETLWMIGVDSRNARYRICHFKRNESLNPQFQKMRWGLMHTDIPLASSHDPVSVNIVWEKIDVSENLEGFLKKNVRYVGMEMADHPRGETIRELVNGQWQYLPNILKTDHLALEKLLTFAR